jgi:hypothetical protein
MISSPYRMQGPSAVLPANHGLPPALLSRLLVGISFFNQYKAQCKIVRVGGLLATINYWLIKCEYAYAALAVKFVPIHFLAHVMAGNRTTTALIRYFFTSMDSIHD